MTPKYKKVYCSVLDGWRRALWRSSRKHNPSVFSYWSVCSWHTALNLHNPGLQVHRNIWTSSGETERSCWKRAEQTGWLAWVHRQHWEAGRYLPLESCFTAVGLKSYHYKYLSARAKVHDLNYMQKNIFFWCWLCTYLFTCYLLITLHYAPFILVVKI